MNLYKEFFYVPKHGKVPEKVMLTRVFISVASILLCLFAMSISAFAYFSADVVSSSNMIKAANFSINLSIEPDGEAATVMQDVQSRTVTLAAGEYTITVTRSAQSTAKTGFGILYEEGSEVRYHTAQVGVDGSVQDSDVSFQLIVSKETEVTFLAHWGTSSYYGYQNLVDNPLYIKGGEKVSITVDSQSSNGDSTDGNSTDSDSAGGDSTDGNS